MRKFATGATRNDDTGKLDYDGFLSPLALEAFAKYMHQHRIQADGKLRDSDNWQKGIPVDQYRKSLWRHFFDVWRISRGYDADGVELVEALCAVMFNAQGMLHEELKKGAVYDAGRQLVDSIEQHKAKSIAKANADMEAEALSLAQAGTTLSELDSGKINAVVPKAASCVHCSGSCRCHEMHIACSNCKIPRSLYGPGEKKPEGPFYYETVKDGKLGD